MSPSKSSMYVLAFLFSVAGFSSQDVATSSSPIQVCVTHIEAPQYVKLARDVGLQGEVVVQVGIDSAGHVTESSVLSGHPLLANEAKRNAMLWAFTPGTKGFLQLKYRFSLAGVAAETMAAPRIIFELPNTVEIVTNPKPTYPATVKTSPSPK